MKNPVPFENVIFIYNEKDKEKNKNLNLQKYLVRIFVIHFQNYVVQNLSQEGTIQ